MNNQNAKNTPKTYDAGDLWDIQSLAEFDMNWMEVAISDIKNRLKEIKAELGGKDVLGFYALENVIDMYQYIAENVTAIMQSRQRNIKRMAWVRRGTMNIKPAWDTKPDMFEGSISNVTRKHNKAHWRKWAMVQVIQ